MTSNIRRLWVISISAAILLTAMTSMQLRAGSGSFDDLQTAAPATVVDATAAFSYTAAEPGRSYPAAVVATVAPGWHINSASPLVSWLIAAQLEFDTIPGAIPAGVSYPEGTTLMLMDENMSVYDGRTIIRFSVIITDDAPEGDLSLPLRFTYQACDNTRCLPPETIAMTVTIPVGPGGQPVTSDIFAGIDIGEVSTGTEPEDAAADTDLGRLIAEYGVWGYLMALGLAFITGLLLSFSPCTYPMIPITVSVFAGQDRSIWRGFILSLFYVGSMAVMYGIMGLIVSLVGGVFGAWLASPAVVIGIAVIFVIFSLSMFGLFELNVPSGLRQKLGAQKGGGGVTGSILLGVVAALVVSPCVGPFVAGILLYIATYGSPVFGFLTLFIFALGLGALYVIIGTFSSAITRLPRAGEWMDQVKKFFGFVLLLMALYFLRTIVSPTVTAVLTGLLLLAFGTFGGGLDRLSSEAGFFIRFRKFIGILALLVGSYLILGAMISQGFILPAASKWLPVAGAAPEKTETSLIPWQTDLEQGLASARAAGKPVLIDTWATWCVNCRVLEKKTFGNAAVAAEAERFIPLKIQLEKAGTPEAMAFMERFNMRHYSLPTTLLLDADGNVRKIMQGVVGPEEMIAEMRKVP